MNVNQVLSMGNSMAAMETAQSKEAFHAEVLKSAIETEEDALQTLLSSLTDVGKIIDVRA